MELKSHATLPAVAALCLPLTVGNAQADALEAMTFDLRQIWAVESGDWNADAVVDAALIFGPSNQQDDAGLALFLSDAETGRLELDAWLPNLLWGNRQMYGQEPRLVLDDFGRLVVVTQNSAIGRGRWEQSFTLTWQKGWRGEGFSYDFYDTLEMSAQGRCDLDYLSQTGTIARGEQAQPQAFELAAVPPPPIDEWQAVDALGTCGLLGD